MSEAPIKTIQDLECDQNRLEELLFLVDAKRRPRIHKMLARIQAQVAELSATANAPQNLVELRAQRGELEHKLFAETAERRSEIKKMLAIVRAEIETAEAVALLEEEREKGGDLPLAA